jgi:hypothetical protein
MEEESCESNDTRTTGEVDGGATLPSSSVGAAEQEIVRFGMRIRPGCKLFFRRCRVCMGPYFVTFMC